MDTPWLQNKMASHWFTREQNKLVLCFVVSVFTSKQGSIKNGKNLQKYMLRELYKSYGVHLSESTKKSSSTSGPTTKAYTQTLIICMGEFYKTLIYYGVHFSEAAKKVSSLW